MTDTIYALATPPGRGAIAIVRMSGPSTQEALDRLGAAHLRPRVAALRTLIDAKGEPFDQALCLWFPAPSSFTGEDCAELHLHGGRAVVEACVTALGALGLRPAEPGEFSRRAFQNGRLDLTQAEAIADLVDAESEGQRRQALGQLGGALSARYGDWRARLVRVLALLEAEIDFPDEDTPAAAAEQAAPELTALVADIDAALQDAVRGRRVREGYRIALIGAANAGKSTLFNRLAGREAAIVTPIAGTTRDVLEAALVIDGQAVTLIDTAGLRETGDVIEAEGVRRARAQAEAADLRLWIRGPEEPADEAAALMLADDLVVLSKADLGGQRAPSGREALAVSVGDDASMSRLGDWISARIRRDTAGTDAPAVTRERHRLRLVEARDHLAAAATSLARGPERAADDVRLAAAALAAVVGEVGVEEVLGEVFSTFCIGK